MEELKANQKFWKKVFGSALYDELLGKKEDVYRDEVPHQLFEELYEQILAERGQPSRQYSKILFGNFYAVFFRIAEKYLENKGVEKSFPLWECMERSLESAFGTIASRVLIFEIHRCKRAGRLAGRNAKEEYEYYEDVFLNDKDYIDRICKKYPEMRRLLFVKIYDTTEFLCEISTLLVQDHKEIINEICGGVSFERVCKIELGSSDSHDRGKTIAKVWLDNEQQIIYKPHGLEKEQLFSQLYGKYMSGLGLSARTLKMICREGYGWEECIETKECQEETQVERYFLRMGILLFICYSFDATDVHCQNIMAYGEYPILLDLETFPGIKKYRNSDNAEQLVIEKIRQSVIYTGILPVMIWGEEESDGVVLNAIHEGKSVQTPFRLPEIVDSFSSDIHIEYRNKEMDIGASLPRYQGEDIDAAEYVGWVVDGFKKAYQYFLDNRSEIWKEMEQIFQYGSRMLLRHTQQYGMYLSISLYPEFLQSSERRKLFLHILDKNRTEDFLLAAEREAMCQMDIPLFIVRKNQIFQGNETRKCGDFKENPWKQWVIKAQEFCLEDMEYQVGFIRLSMSMLKKENKEKNCVKDHSGTDDIRTIKEKIICQFIENICREALVCRNQKDVNWRGLKFYGKNWSFAPLGMYLYDGISGIAVCLTMLLKNKHSPEGDKLLEIVKIKLFRYTEQIIRGEALPESVCTGALIGEGSIVNAYLWLYQITNEKIYLEYANKHYAVLEMILSNEQDCDYLSGYAGAIEVILRLYKETKQRKLLEKAAQLGEILWKEVKEQEQGAGIVIRGMEQPLAGMAHGNSGVVFSYAGLLEETGSSIYEKRICELLLYEDTLYCEEIHNWSDLRNQYGQKEALNAWCHGAAGILLSRMRLQKISGFKEKEIVERDICRCVDSLEHLKIPQSLCLCHGCAGVYAIMQIYLKTNKNRKLKQLCDKLEKEMISRIYYHQVSDYERYSLSMMQGLLGAIAVLQFTDKK